MGRAPEHMQGRAWTKQLNFHIEDMSDGKGINISTIIYVSRYTGKLVLYDGIRIGVKREGRISVDMGKAFSGEDLEKYRVGREYRPRVRRELKATPPSMFI